jgi:hypothetical protein
MQQPARFDLASISAKDPIHPVDHPRAPKSKSGGKYKATISIYYELKRKIRPALGAKKSPVLGAQP